MNPKIYNIELKRGADFNLELQMTDDNDEPIDLTNYSWRSQLRERPESELSYDFTISTTPSKGIVSISMPYTMTEQIMFTDGVYDLYYVGTNGQVECLLQGKVSVIWKSTDLNDTGVPLPIDPIRVLDIINGGTSASTAAGARENLGLGSMAIVNSPVPLANGGTGATTAAGARENLGLKYETNTENIKPDGTASVGALTTVARADHVHPYNDSGWISFTLLNSWYDWGGWGLPGYRKVNGRVQLRGLIGKPDTNYSQTIAVLPAGFRPVNNSMFPVVHQVAYGAIGILTDGTVRLEFTTQLAAGAWLVLQGISFFVG